MIKANNIYWPIMALIILLVSCSKEEEFDQFSKLGAEQDKQNIEAAGIAMTNEIEGLSQTSFVSVSKELVRLMNSAGSSHQNMIYSIASLGDAMANGESVQAQFDLLLSLTTDHCNDLSIIWNKGFGIWEWNPELNDFEQVSESGEDITLKFPASIEDASNNALLRLYGFETYSGAFPGKGDVLEDGSMVEEILKSLYFEMKVDGNLVASSNIILEFSDTGNIENLNLTFNPIPYSFQAELSYQSNKANWRYTFSNDAEIIFEQLVAVLFDGNIETEGIIKEVSSSIQIMDIKMIGKANAVELLNDIYAIESKGLEGESHAKATAEAVNNNTSLSIRYTNNDMIAKGRAVALSDDESTDWIVDLLFEFSDGSTEYAGDLLNSMYAFENELDLILKKAENKLN